MRRLQGLVAELPPKLARGPQYWDSTGRTVFWGGINLANPVYGRRSSAASRTRTSPGMSDGALPSRQLSALQPLGKRTLSDFATPDLQSPSPYKTARGSDPLRDRDEVDDQSSHASVCGHIDGLREEARLPTAPPLRLSPKTLLGLASRNDTLALAPTLAPALAHSQTDVRARTHIHAPGRTQAHAYSLRAG